MTQFTQEWGRHSCLRNAAHPSLNCARTTVTRRVAQAGVGLCAVAFPGAASFSLQKGAWQPSPLSESFLSEYSSIRNVRKSHKTYDGLLSDRHEFTHNSDRLRALTNRSSSPEASSVVSIHPADFRIGSRATHPFAWKRMRYPEIQSRKTREGEGRARRARSAKRHMKFL